MLNELAPFIMTVAVFFLITNTIVNFMKYRLKRRIVESGMREESSIKAILQTRGSKGEVRAALKWGLLVLFGGMGLVLNEFLPFESDTSVLPYGIELIFLSFGLLLYYLIVKKQSSTKSED